MGHGSYRPGVADLGNGRRRFVVWAPRASTVELRLLTPREQRAPMTRGPRSYFSVTLDGIPQGATYRYVLDGERELPDPASRHQPEGPHGPSAVVDAAFSWTDEAWRGVPQRELTIYELHVGAFSEAGTFDGAIPHLDYLRDLGVTAIELLPIAQFPGERNWGYDGVYPYAAQHSYGGPDGLRRLVDACHARGMAVLLDCVYNHLGPDGNYLSQFGPYFTDRYKTPWGDAINMDGAGSDEVRRFFIESGLHWMDAYHIDGFRLDAADHIIDESATHFLQAFAAAMHERAEQTGRRVVIIAESDANDARYVEPTSRNGYGLDGQWGDDLHHALHTLLTGERDGYYADYGTLDQLAKALRQVFCYDGVYSPTRQRTHGNSPRMTRAEQFVVATQNHDQVGNRAQGERLCHLVSFERAKLAAAVVLLSPYIPLIFMGEEYAETAPFLYFTSHGDPELAEAVSQGRREEFGAFEWADEVPDPQAEDTFLRARLNHGLREREPHRSMWRLYRNLLYSRRELPALRRLDKDATEVTALHDTSCLVMRRWHDDHHVAVAFNFSDQLARLTLHLPDGEWRVALDTSSAEYGGPGAANDSGIVDGCGHVEALVNASSAVLLERTAEA